MEEEFDVSKIIDKNNMEVENDKFFNPLFNGKCSRKIDAKGRLFIPSEYREKLEDKVVLLRTFENCISIYTYGVWKKNADNLARLNDLVPENRALKDLWFGGAFTLEIDKQGRIVVPKDLKESTGIEDMVVVVGSGNVIKLWQPNEYAIQDEKNRKVEFSSELIQRVSIC